VSPTTPVKYVTLDPFPEPEISPITPALAFLRFIALALVEKLVGISPDT